MLNSSVAEPIYRYLGLASAASIGVVCLLGVVGNSLSLAIFLQPHFRCLSINVLLAALSVADLCLCLLAIPVFGSAALTSFCENWPLLHDFHTFVTLYLYPVTIICHCCSVWLLVAVTIERWIAVCKPMRVLTNNRTHTIMAILGITLVSILYNIVRFREFVVSKDKYEPELLLRKNPLYMLWYATISSLVVLYIVPLALMVYFNISVAREVFRSVGRRSDMSPAQRTDHKTAHMLLFVELTFVCCYTPSFALNVLETIIPHLFHQHLGYALCDLINILVLMNSSTSFIFYLHFCTRYRLNAKMFVARWFCPRLYEQYLILNYNNDRLFSLSVPMVAVGRHPTTPVDDNSLQSFRRRSKRARRYYRRYKSETCSNNSQNIHLMPRKTSEPTTARKLSPAAKLYSKKHSDCTN